MKLFEMLDMETLASDDRRAQIWINAANLLIQLHQVHATEALVEFNKNFKEWLRLFGEEAKKERE
jgi:hypothetical protein